MTECEGLNLPKGVIDQFLHLDVVELQTNNIFACAAQPLRSTTL